MKEKESKEEGRRGHESDPQISLGRTGRHSAPQPGSRTQFIGTDLDLQAQLLQRRPHDLRELVGVHQAGPQAVVQVVALPRAHPGHQDKI